MHQSPQPTTSNFNRNDKNEHPKKWTIIGNVTEKGFPLKTFVDWLNNGINYAKEETYLHQNQLPINGQPHNTNANLIEFATNIELETQDFTFVEPKNEVDKLPYMLSPNGKGNLLNYAGENIVGLNSDQLYVKAPGSRTSIHPENSTVASFNHNIGRGDCVWYGVPLK